MIQWLTDIEGAARIREVMIVNIRTNFSVGPVILTTALFFALASTAFAAHPEVSLPGSDFEIDTNANLMVDDTAPPSEDWGNVAENRVTDELSGSGDDAFGQGSKEDTPIPSVVSGSIPPNKSDLKTFGVYVEEAGPVERFLHLFWTRVQDPSGTTNMDFEFNQSNIISSNGVTPLRTSLDMLIQYDLANGGTSPELFLSFWIDGSEGATAADCEASNKLPCWGLTENLTDSGLATGSINTSAIPAVDADGLGALSARTFGEASIDFDEVGSAVGGDVCLTFGSAYLKSRSSDSFGSALKDFIAPILTNVSNCASIKITKQDDEMTLLGGVDFDVYLDESPFGGTRGAEDALVDSCTTASEGSGLGMCVVPDLLPGDYWVVEDETTVPAGHTPPVLEALVSVITPGTQAQVTITNPRIPATVNIHKEDDVGADLADAVFTLYNDVSNVGTFDGDPPDTTTGLTCTTDADGDCTIGDILPPGFYCVVETTTPAGHDTAAPQCIELDLAETVNLTFVDDRQPATVEIHKEDDDGADLADAVFTLYNDVVNVGTFDGDPPDTTTGLTCTTDANGDCTISNILPPGDYCVVETTTPAGHDTAAPQCTNLSLNETVNLTFVDDRQPATVNIHKEDDDTPANDLEGAQFTLYNDIGIVGTYEDGTDTSTGKICTTDADGDCTISNILPPGDYCVVETVTPSGYETADPQCINLDLNETVNLTFVDPRKKGSITISKTDDADPANPLAGAMFTLYEDLSNIGTFDGDPPDTSTGLSCTTDALGECSISDVAPGDYCLDETAVPDGYHKADPQCFTLDLDEEESLNFVDPRKLGAIMITKTRKHAADGSGDHAHAGVEFTITGGELPPGGSMVTTAADGTTCLDGLVISDLVGDYTVTESVPAGYVADGDNPKTVSVTNAAMTDISCGSGNEDSVSFANTPLTDITVSVDSLVDGGTASTIECKLGAAIIGSASTDAFGDGSLTLSNLEPETYVCTIVVDP